jgi:sarcosine oxidase subunit gamma
MPDQVRMTFHGSTDTMPESAERRSPVHHLLETPATVWGRLDGAPIALRLGEPAEETAAVQSLALCDLSALPKFGVKGPAAETFLRGQDIIVPGTTYDTRPLVGGGLIVRFGATDFFLEGGTSGAVLSRVSAALDSEPGVYRVERQDSTFLLCGARALEVLAQLCSIDFRDAPPRRLALTRAGGVNCGILPDPAHPIPHFRFWVDPSYAVSFWEVLVEIAGELGGRVVGAACFYPELSQR